MRAGQAASMRTEPHPSFQNVMNATLAGNKGQFMAPAQLAELAEAQIAAQAGQQAAVQQAAAAQAAQAAQNQQVTTQTLLSSSNANLKRDAILAGATRISAMLQQPACYLALL